MPVKTAKKADVLLKKKKKRLFLERFLFLESKNVITNFYGICWTPGYRNHIFDWSQQKYFQLKQANEKKKKTQKEEFICWLVINHGHFRDGDGKKSGNTVKNLSLIPASFFLSFFHHIWGQWEPWLASTIRFSWLGNKRERCFFSFRDGWECDCGM